MRWTAVLLTGAASVLAAGCGESESYSNEPRPPAPIVLTASINKDEISVSPTKFGAGPVSLVITNQTGAPQEITFETAGRSAGFSQSTGPINPKATATLKENVKPGEVTVKVKGGAIDAATITVGAERPSAQNDLLQP